MRNESLLDSRLRPSGAWLFHLKVQPQHSLELAALVAFVLDEPERIFAVDVEIRTVWERMVEDIRRIQPDLQVPGFTDSNHLSHCLIEAPLSGQIHCLPPNCPSLSRLRILQDNLS